MRLCFYQFARKICKIEATLEMARVQTMYVIDTPCIVVRNVGPMPCLVLKLSYMYWECRPYGVNPNSAKKENVTNNSHKNTGPTLYLVFPVIVIVISEIFCPKLQDKHCREHYDYESKNKIQCPSLRFLKVLF